MKNHKPFLATLALTCAAACQAAGPFDGIYRNPLGFDSYISIHQNGNHLIATLYASEPIPRGTVSLGGIRPIRLSTWSLLSGDFVNGFARMSGETVYGSCITTFDIWLNADGNLGLRAVNIVASADGAAQGLVCKPTFSGETVAPRVF